MNDELKAKWVAALRSGEYSQGTGYLRQARWNTFCCLGVLADTINPLDWNGQTSDGKGGAYLWRGMSFNLPSEIVSNDKQAILTNMNDIGWYSFDEIATYIEENL